MEFIEGFRFEQAIFPSVCLYAARREEVIIAIKKREWQVNTRKNANISRQPVWQAANNFYTWWRELTTRKVGSSRGKLEDKAGSIRRDTP